MTHSLAKYVGRPYESYNCFALVKEFYKDVFGLELKNYYEGDTPDRKEAEKLILSNKGEFVKVDDYRFGDIAVIRLFGLECHVAIVLDKNRILHSVKTTGSSIERISRYKHLIAGFYRHEEEA